MEGHMTNKYEKQIEKINSSNDEKTNESRIRILVLDMCESEPNDFDILNNIYMNIESISNRIYLKSCLKQTRFYKHNRCWID